MIQENTPGTKDIPESLQQSKSAKISESEKAREALEKEVQRGETLLAAVGYISFLCVLPLVLMKKSRFAQYHGKQALVLAIVFYFCDVFLVDFFQSIFPAIGSFYALFKTGLIFYAIYACLNASWFKLPIVHSISQKFDINFSQE